MMKQQQQIFAELQSLDKPAALCTIISVKGSSPLHEGAKMLIREDGTILGTIGGGNLEKKVITDALTVIESGNTATFSHDLLHQHAMCCGGVVKVFIEPFMPKNRLFIFGAGHVGKALALAALPLDFDIVVIDDRKEFVESLKHHEISTLHLSFPDALKALPFNSRTYICILTYSHAVDRDLLFHCLKQPHAYLGMIGSRRKVQVTRKMMLESGHANDAEMDAIDMPMGLDIGAEGPEEIAISILSKVISVKNQNKPKIKSRLFSSKEVNIESKKSKTYE